MMEQAGEQRGPFATLAVRVVNALGKPLGINLFPRAFPNEISAPCDQVFDRIYQSNLWASEESRSGRGSEAGFAESFVRELAQGLWEIGASSLFDAPCGDLNWLRPLARERWLTYQGGDISPALIADLKRRYPDLALRKFDICRDDFPKADVWLCRDCLFHLPFADVRRALEKFAASSIPFALITTHKARVHRNLDVNAGGFRYLDLERAPISLPSAERYLRDYRPLRDFPRFVGLWRREVIAEALARGS